jgi:N-methylhydantoinase A/oxoprolinase/acetone carboxylase beta subunit
MSLPSGGAPGLPRVHVIACGVLAVDLEAITKRLGLSVTTTFLPGGLHNNPHELHLRLQKAIDAASDPAKADWIAVGYGVCGRGTVGLQARGVPLAIPQVHDCIALFLGSDRAYREQFAKYPGTYYFSAGWVEEKVRPWSSEEKEPGECRSPLAHDLETLERQHGRENAEAIRDFLNSWHHNYQRAAFIDTGEGRGRRDRYAEMAKAMATEFGWAYEEIPGTHELLTRLLVAPGTTEGILVVPPGHATLYDAAQRRLRAVPVREGETAPEPILIICDETPESEFSGRSARLGLGIDAGGTYTDIVLYDFDTHAVLQKAKSLTTKWDHSVGIGLALDQLDASRFAEVDLVSVSTTLATNAIVEGRGQRVGLLLMTPYGWPPSEFFTHELLATISGQLEVDGRELVPVNADEVRKVVRAMLDHQQVQAFAVAGYASDVNPAHEAQVRAAIREETEAAVTCANEVSEGANYRIRAETAVLNAQIIPCLNAFLEKVQTTLHGKGLRAPIMVVKSDGSLMSIDAARRRPIETILSGPAASVAGASFLTGIADAMVVDIGGTTTDTATIRHGAVETCKDGATVGGWKTHVEALDMRTLGLGGDSRIAHVDGALVIGPQRITPVAWLAAQHPRTGEALEWLSHHLNWFDRSTRGMELLALTPYEHRGARNERESRVVERLKERPYTVAELVEREKCDAEEYLPLAGLEEDYVIQRCGLTPTDLLHADGRLSLWDGEASRRVCDLYAALMHTDRARFIEQGLTLFVRQLALELLKKQLADEVDPDLIDASPVAAALIERALGERADGFSVKIALKAPVIGIGAPAHFFLPAAARLLQAEAVIPVHADVANAIGAITSLVRIHRRVAIGVNEVGLFRVEGLFGTPTFNTVEEAQEVAVPRLREMVRDLGRQAGTGQSRVEIRIHDRIAPLKDGQQLFIERIVEACLIGRPDLARLAAG